MESTMDQNSAESKSVDAISIFAQSIGVRRLAGKSRRRATMKVLSPEIEQQAKPSTERRHQRRAVVERGRARAESELSRATTMAKELEGQLEQANTKATMAKGLQETRASGRAISRRKNGLVDVEASPVEVEALQSNTLYLEVMQELDRVKSELRRLQRAVRSTREDMAKAERDAEMATPRLMSSQASDSLVVSDSVKGEADEERVIAEVPEIGETNRECVVADHTVADGLSKGIQVQATPTRTRAMAIIGGDTSLSSVTESFATASSSEVEDESARTIKQYEEHNDASLHAAESELNSARIELASVKGEADRFVDSVERTRREAARVAEEISRLQEQQDKASAQVQQLDDKLLRARSRLEAVAAADERAEATLAELTSALRQLDEETEAAEKERSLTELESQCVREDAEKVSAEIAAAEQRIRQSVRELEAARASEAAATSKLTAAIDSAMLARVAVMSPTSGTVTIARFEYEYLTGRAEVVRAAAEKKVAAAEAWVEALRAGEKELAMRAEAIEKEIGEAIMAGEAEGAGYRRAARMEPQDDVSLQRAPRRRDREAPATSGRTRTRSSSAVRKPTPPSFDIEKKKLKARVQSSCLKVIARKCSGHS